MQSVDTYEWVFTSAQTDLLLLDDTGASLVPSDKRMAVTYVELVCSNSNTGDVSARLGFAATTLPAIVNNSPNGKKKVFTYHPGLAKGGGKVNANGGATLAMGAAGESPRFTCSAATGGSVALIMSFTLVDATVT